MTAKRSVQRKPDQPSTAQSPRITVVISEELDEWIKRSSKASGLAEGAFVRMKLTELFHADRNQQQA